MLVLIKICRVCDGNGWLSSKTLYRSFVLSISVTSGGRGFLLIVLDSDQTGRMPKLIWDFAGRTVILLVLSWGGSFGCYVNYCDQPARRRGRWSLCWSFTCVSMFCGFTFYYSSSWCRRRAAIFDCDTLWRYFPCFLTDSLLQLSLVTRKSVFGIFDQVRLKTSLLSYRSKLESWNCKCWN